jgi:hypothetical protein
MADDKFPRVGFTGTRYAVPPQQRWLIDSVLDGLYRTRGAVELHQGDCVGADEYAANSGASLGYLVVCHPPTNPLLRAHGPSHVVRPPRPYLQRNRAIVDETDILLAVPSDSHEVQRSGTWATIRYARKLNRPRVVMGPDGEIIECVGIVAPTCPF